MNLRNEKRTITIRLDKDIYDTLKKNMSYAIIDENAEIIFKANTGSFNQWVNYTIMMGNIEIKKAFEKLIKKIEADKWKSKAYF